MFGESLPCDQDGFIATIDDGPWDLNLIHDAPTHDSSGALTAYGLWWFTVGWPDYQASAIAGAPAPVHFPAGAPKAPTREEKAIWKRLAFGLLPAKCLRVMLPKQEQTGPPKPSVFSRKRYFVSPRSATPHDSASLEEGVGQP